MKKIMLSLIMVIVFCLSAIPALGFISLDTCNLEDYYVEDDIINFDGVLFKVNDIDTTDNDIKLKHLETGEMYDMDIGHVASRDGISVKLLDIDNSGIEPTAHLCFKSDAECANLAYHPENQEFGFSGLWLKVTDIDLSNNEIDLKFTDSGVLYNIDVGEEIENEGISVRLLAVKEFSTPAPAFSSALLCMNEIEEEKFTPPFLIAVGDNAPASDVMTATQLTIQLKDAGYDIPVGSVKLFSEVNAYVAEQKVVTAIYKDEAVIIVGSYSPAEYVIFAIDIHNILEGRGLSVNTILDTELESPDLIDLFVTEPEPEIVCSESDDGKNYYVKGSACMGGICKTDYCSNSNLVEYYLEEEGIIREGYCDPYTDIFSVTYNCPSGCSNGACLEEPSIRCTDSDGGKNYYKQGIVEINLPGLHGTSEDFCDGNGDLVEFMCPSDQNSGQADFDFYHCPYGCKNGACTREPEDDDEPLVIVREQVKCLFVSATEQEKCYSTEPHEMSCIGKTSCKIDVVGREDDKITWKSTCGGYAYTKMDGRDEYIKFDCSDEEEIEVPTCTDGIWNDGETGVDCGGPCPPCVETTKTCTNGCLSDSTCLPFGTRMVDDNKNPIFCNLNKEFDRQKQDSHICQNSYECLSNSCHNGRCISLEKEIRETRGILENIFEWLRSLFG